MACAVTVPSAGVAVKDLTRNVRVECELAVLEELDGALMLLGGSA